MRGQIHVGTASWADPGFIADWYPPKLPASERLPYYAAHFSLVELNSSFYAVPNRTLVQRWCAQTPPGFIFDVKLHRLLSRHSTSLKALPPALRGLAEVQGDKVQLTPRLEKSMTQFFLQETDPFSASGKLGAYLLQLTPAFSPFKHKLEELDTIIELLAGHRLGIELRNRHWIVGEQAAQTMAFFKERHLTFVGVDAPETEHFMAMPNLDIVSNPQLAYLRLHGRNAKGYLTGKTVAERFDYLYSDDELKAVAQRAAHLAQQAAHTHIIYNNNSSDYALRNAATFQQMLARKHGQAKSRTATGDHPAPESTWGKTLEFDFTPDTRGTKPSSGRQ